MSAVKNICLHQIVRELALMNSLDCLQNMENTDSKMQNIVKNEVHIGTVTKKESDADLDVDFEGVINILQGKELVLNNKTMEGSKNTQKPDSDSDKKQ